MFTRLSSARAAQLTRLLCHTLLALPLASGWALAQTAPDANALFSWAERSYPSLFPAGPSNQTFPPYTFRAYNGGHYLAIANSRVYLIGPLTGNQLQDFGPLSQYTCLVTPTATGCPGATDTVLAEVKDLLQRDDALWAQSIPTNATFLTNVDGCYQTDGRTTTMISADRASDTQYNVSNAYRVGGQRINVEILAVRNTTNSDGSSRREIDVKYDRKHTDGTTTKGILNTLISGSSFGTCPTPTSNSALRFFGNQRAAFVYVSRYLSEGHQFNITNGAAISQTVFRGFSFGIRDYQDKFTYAIVSGPGPSTTSNGQTYSFALKLLAPRIVRDDPTMVGKRGHFTNWDNDNTFRLCRSATSGTPNAVLADCVGAGTQGAGYGITWSKSTTPTGAAAADTSFSNLGLGGEYTFALYNDDGWKTVNGHAGKTPVVTYKVTQKDQPYTFASLVNGTEATGRMPYFEGLFGGTAYSATTFATLSQGTGGVEFVTNALRLPSPPDGAVFVPRLHSHYYEGPLTTNASNAYYPANRYSNATYMPFNATTGFSRVLPNKNSSVSRIGYMDVTLEFTNRDNHSLMYYKAFNTP
jgi:hypothetical protein